MSRYKHYTPNTQEDTVGGDTPRESGRTDYAAVPDELRKRKQWLCWRWEQRPGGKLTKVPYNPATGDLADTTDPATWATFKYAVSKAATGQYDGIGFVFSRKDAYAGIDLDHCRDSQTGEIAPWAKRFLALLDGGYAEVSPSGTGVHIIVRGKVPPGGHKRAYETGAVEMYDWGRFFTVTGQVLP